MSNEFSPVASQDPTDYLAQKIADRLGDPAGLPAYRNLAKIYLPSYLIHVMNQVKDIPDDQIRKSRAALFMWLVKHPDGQRPFHTAPPPENLPIAPSLTPSPDASGQELPLPQDSSPW